jgi:hypothetical protein
LQEEFESLKDALSAVLGEAQQKNHDIQHPTAASPTSPIIPVASKNMSLMIPCTNNVCNDGLAEVLPDFESKKKIYTSILSVVKSFLYIWIRRVFCVAHQLEHLAISRFIFNWFCPHAYN